MTLIEVLVTLALLAAAGMGLFGWLLTTQESQWRSERALAESELQLAALGVVGTINPMEQPTGRIDVGSMQVSWRSQPLTPVTETTGGPEQSMGAWQLALYRVELEVRGGSADAPVKLSVVRTGRRMQAAMAARAASPP